MDPRLIDLAGAAAIAVAVFMVAALIVRALCRRPLLRRLSLALTLTAFAGSLALFRYLGPGPGDGLKPYLYVLTLFALAYLAFKIVEVFMLDVVAVRQGRVAPPAILREICSAIFAVVALVVLLRMGLGVDVTALVATSAALTIVLGLALQETLANLFAGLALMIDRPFESGDWIRIGDRVGRIQEVSWRAVKVQIQKQEDYLIIPNSVVAKAEIVNMSRPSPIHGHSIEVGVAYAEPPNRVTGVLEHAALEAEGVLPMPPPFALVSRFDNFSIVYRLTYYIRDFANWNEIQGAVLAHVWYAFRRRGIQIPFPTSNVYWRDAAMVDAARHHEEFERVAGLLRSVDFLAALTQEEVERLATEVRIEPYPAGMVVVRQGEPGDSLFVVASGRVQVSLHSPNGGPERTLAVIEAGDYFGELSLLTGAPRSATIRTLEDTDLLVLSRDALRPVLLNDPAAAGRLCRTLEKRKAEHVDAILHDPATDASEPSPVPSGSLLGRIRRFFDLIGGER